MGPKHVVECRKGIVERPVNTIQTVDHEEFRSRDPDEAHAWLRKTYADHHLKISGSSEDFMFSCDITRLDGMSFGRMRHSMAVDVDVFAGLRDLSIVEHRGGGAVQVVDRARKCQPTSW